jgi:tetratricopeptide (TPR) repeat protein
MSDDAVLLYNLGVLLDDQQRGEEALAAYEAAVVSDPDFADAHYNLGLLCESLGRAQDAIRHMARYRVLARR